MKLKKEEELKKITEVIDVFTLLKHKIENGTDQDLKKYIYAVNMSVDLRGLFALKSEIEKENKEVAESNKGETITLISKKTGEWTLEPGQIIQMSEDDAFQVGLDLMLGVEK